MTDAYAVPWVVNRSVSGEMTVSNVSQETLHGVWWAPLGPALGCTELPRDIRPGRALTVRLHGRDLRWDTLVVIRWRRDDGSEYLWRFVP